MGRLLQLERLCDVCGEKFQVDEIRKTKRKTLDLDGSIEQGDEEWVCDHCMEIRHAIFNFFGVKTGANGTDV